VPRASKISVFVLLPVGGYRATTESALNQPSESIWLTSVLKRAIRTLWLALDEMDLMWIPVERTWLSNERHYGSLQGLNKIETVEKYGEEQVQILADAGDDRTQMVAPSEVREELNDNRILYKKELIGSVEAFVFSNDPNDELYRVTFTLVGANQGDYALSNINAINKALAVR